MTPGKGGRCRPMAGEALGFGRMVAPWLRPQWCALASATLLRPGFGHCILVSTTAHSAILAFSMFRQHMIKCQSHHTSSPYTYKQYNTIWFSYVGETLQCIRRLRLQPGSLCDVRRLRLQNRSAHTHTHAHCNARDAHTPQCMRARASHAVRRTARACVARRATHGSGTFI